MFHGTIQVPAPSSLVIDQDILKLFFDSMVLLHQPINDIVFNPACPASLFNLPAGIGEPHCTDSHAG